MIKRHEKTDGPRMNGRNVNAAQSTGPRAARPANRSTAKASDEPPTLRCRINDGFRKFAHRTSEMVGSPWSFILAAITLVIWAALGPACEFSDTWQLVINTATTIVTFLMVFLIQNTQNRDAKAIHLKLDELIRGVKGARNKLMNLEDLSEEELTKLQEQFKRMSNAPQHSAPRHDPEKSPAPKAPSETA